MVFDGNLDVKLTHQGWTTDNQTHVKGIAFDGQTPLSNTKLLSRVKEADDAGELQSTLSNVTGQYAIIHRSSEGLHFASDHVRSYPLYYSVSGDGIVSDNSLVVHRQSTSSSYSKIAASEYLFTSYVNGRDTLSNAVKQIQPGEIVTLKEQSGKISAEITSHFTHTERTGGKAVEMNEVDEIFNSIFERILNYADGREIILPLTGGYDSRLIALKLADLGYDNITAYTVASSEGSTDLRLARGIADDLGIKHLHVTRDQNKYQQFRESGRWEELQETAGFLGELPKAGSVISGEQLAAHPEISNSGIRLPGHHALGGASKLPSHLADRDQVHRREFINYIWNNSYVRWRINPLKKSERELERQLKRRIFETTPVDLYQTGAYESTSDAIVGLDAYFWYNRLAKYFLTHYERETLPFETIYPLLDKEYFRYLASVHPSNRVNKALQRRYVEWLGRRLGDSDVLTGGEFESSSGDKFTGDPIGKMKDHVWNHSAQILSSVPRPIERMIRTGYYVGSSSKSYDENPKLGLLPEEFVSQIDARVVHRRPLQLLWLYQENYFDLEEDNLLETALS